MVTDSQTVSVSNSNDIKNILTSCAARNQPVVTSSSQILRTKDWRAVNGALVVDLSRIAHVQVFPANRMALVGPGVRISTLVNEAMKFGMAPEIEATACLDFTFGDWAHESLRLLASTTTGIDGVLRNVKVVAPALSYQTGYDGFPANGGGYDLTKLFMTTGLSLGIPYEFAVTLRPLQDSSVKKIYKFSKITDAVKAGMMMRNSGHAHFVRMRSAGFRDLLTSASVAPGMTQDALLIAKFEGTQKVVELAESALDGIANREGGQPKDRRPDAPHFIDPASINPSAWLFGALVCDTLALPQVISDIGGRADAAKRSFQYCVSDIGQTTSVLSILLKGPPTMDLVSSIGSYLVDSRIPLRGNPAWNSVLGDSRAVARAEVLRGIKKALDPQMTLNPHVMEAI